jgi:hypothetical protein
LPITGIPIHMNPASIQRLGALEIILASAPKSYNLPKNPQSQAG